MISMLRCNYFIDSSAMLSEKGNDMIVKDFFGSAVAADWIVDRNKRHLLTIVDYSLRLGTKV